MDNRYFQSKDTCSFSEFTDWTAYVWEPAILEIPSKPNGIFKAFDEVPPGFLHELKIPIQTVFFASYYPVVVEGKGGGWLINMPVKKFVVNCSHIIGKRGKFGGHS